VKNSLDDSAKKVLSGGRIYEHIYK
jgi:hypothetical protein